MLRRERYGGESEEQIGTERTKGSASEPSGSFVVCIVFVCAILDNLSKWNDTLVPSQHSLPLAATLAATYVFALIQVSPEVRFCGVYQPPERLTDPVL